MQFTQNPDQVSGSKTIYQVSAGEVFWRNFLAGMSRALGSIVVYLLFWLLCGYLFVRYFLPVLKPYADLYSRSLNSLNTINQLSQPGSGTAGQTMGQGQLSLPSGIENEQIKALMQQLQPSKAK